MKRIIMIRYGELSTKKDNKKYFLDFLESSIRKTLKDVTINILKYKSRMYIEYNIDDEEFIIDKLKRVPGIIGFSISYIVKTDIKEIELKILELSKNMIFDTFKVVTKRVYKLFEYDSNQVNNIIGSHIIKNINKKVDVHNPDLTINIEIRDKENSYIYFNEYKGLGGYPVSSNGRGLLMISGGIDSPVAGYLSIKRGISLDAVYFESIPHTSLNARNKVINLSKVLNEYSNDINLYIVPFTKIQELIYKNVESSYVITIMRRMMYRITAQLAESLNIKVIINGESIGQVSSQTLSNLYVINSVTTMPIIRPLACLDKLDIINISKEIKTYDISILPYEDCCTIFIPKHPVLNPTITKCIEEENKLDYKALIEESLDNIYKINISEYNNFDDLL